jgi:hypothetical protein
MEFTLGLNAGPRCKLPSLPWLLVPALWEGRANTVLNRLGKPSAPVCSATGRTSTIFADCPNSSVLQKLTQSQRDAAVKLGSAKAGGSGGDRTHQTGVR